MILAIDVGGTKMAAGLVARDGTVTRSVRAATPQGADAETLWKTLREHARMRFARRLEVVPAALGQEAGLVGAAALILAGEHYG
ncbi:hypothetical protein [Nonomuraea sp. B19D2]|uniref:hypothetical protein n=1 Tax=Nonomuraea sp. B19D2 TaxID=3159561 RepID=UPI0032DA84A3